MGGRLGSWRRTVFQSGWTDGDLAQWQIGVNHRRVTRRAHCQETPCLRRQVTGVKAAARDRASPSQPHKTAPARSPSRGSRRVLANRIDKTVLPRTSSLGTSVTVRQARSRSRSRSPVRPWASQPPDQRRSGVCSSASASERIAARALGHRSPSVSGTGTEVLRPDGLRIDPQGRILSASRGETWCWRKRNVRPSLKQS